MTPSSYIVYTLAIEPEGTCLQKNLALILVKTLRATGFKGRIIVFHNGIAPETSDCEWLRVDYPMHDGYYNRPEIWAYKYSQFERLLLFEWEEILFLDADCFVQKDVTSLFGQPFDIVAKVESGRKINLIQFNGYLDAEQMKLDRSGYNSGTFLIKRPVFAQIMQQWCRIAEQPIQNNCPCHDQAAWNRILLDTEFVVGEFGLFEVVLPLIEGRWADHKLASVLHFVGTHPTDKLSLSYALLIARFGFNSKFYTYHILPI